MARPPPLPLLFLHQRDAKRGNTIRAKTVLQPNMLFLYTADTKKLALTQEIHKTYPGGDPPRPVQYICIQPPASSSFVCLPPADAERFF